MPATGWIRRTVFRLTASAILVLIAAGAVAVLLPAVVPAGSEHDGRVGVADGEDPRGRGWSPSSTAPAVARLDPAPRRAVQAAASDAAGDGRDLRIVSGWRSHDYQQQLFDRAVRRYGGVAQAERWVAPPGRSRHETGDAVDVGGYAEIIWMQHHGAAHGLCRIYANEPWHYELAEQHGECPPMRADGADHG